MTGAKGESGNVLRLTRNEPENYCRPAVDPMLGSLVPRYGSRLLAIVLTSIGSDGCKRSQAVAAAGGCSADFDTPAKIRVLEGMANMLAPDGFLYLGDAETVVGETDRCQIMQGQRAIHPAMNKKPAHPFGGAPVLVSDIRMSSVSSVVCSA